MRNLIKNKIAVIFNLLLVTIALTLYSCSEDFLNLEPLDEISDATFFKNAGDLRSYMTGRYGTLVRGDQRWNGLANGSDNYFGAGPNSSLTRINAVGNAPETSSGWNNAYSNIRNINYFIENAYRVTERTAAVNHYTGEGYYARATYYFGLLQTFGDVPIITEVLNTDSELLYKQRDSRTMVADLILQDLDSAILNMQVKGQGEAVQGRLNKQSALVMKTRVALYEGTWEKYHGQKSTPFAVENANPDKYLQQAVAAGQQLIDLENNNIFNTGVNGYFDLFTQKDYSSTPGAYFYRAYDRGLSITNNWHDEGVVGWGAGTSHEAVSQYLNADGLPQEISTISIDETSLRSVIDNKDPRLNQTIWSPSRGTFYDFFGGASSLGTHNYRSTMPGFITAQQRLPTPSGYRIIKGTPLDVNEWRNGETDDLMIRYGEGLLNFAEAKAELGTISQGDLDQSINLLRNRAGLKAMDLAEVNGWGINYSSRDGYETSAPNIINEIRRERRVELMFEGFRVEDLKRWAIFQDVINGFTPRGAHMQQFLTFWNSTDSLTKYGFAWAAPEAVILTVGNNVDAFSDGFVNPYFRNSDFNEGGPGYYIDPDRDYLSGIPSQQIQVYQTKGGITLTQNPGWF